MDLLKPRRLQPVRPQVVLPVLLEQPAHLVHLVHRAQGVHQAHPVFLVQGVRRVQLEPEVVLVHKEFKV